MATQRKIAARGKATSTRKAARPARAAARPAAKPKARATGSARPAAKAAVKPAPKPALKPGAKVARVIGRPAVKGRPKLAAARRAPDPTVRPLGVLPPEHHVKISDRGPAVMPPRPATAPARATREPARAPAVQRVTEKDYKEFEQLLLAERQKIMKEMGHLETTVLKVNQRESAGDLSRYSFHMADAGTDAMEREKAFLLASAEGRILMEIDEALRRLYRGEFGSCEICGQPIGRGRLEAMPNARLCLSCKQKEERASRGAL